jgi:hypothetical protein
MKDIIAKIEEMVQHNITFENVKLAELTQYELSNKNDAPDAVRYAYDSIKRFTK